MKTSREYLHYEDGGHGDLPVVFLHSAGGDLEHFRAQLEHLRRTRRAVAIDLRGHGKSMPLPKGRTLSIEALSEDIGPVLDALSLDRVVLVGHSFGGAVSTAFAAQNPDRVAGLLLLDSATDARYVPKDVVAGIMQALRSDAYWDTVSAHWKPMLKNSTRRVADRVLTDLHDTQQSSVVSALEALFAFDPAATLRRYGGPRLAVYTPVTDTPGAVHQAMPWLPSKSVRGTGHWLQLDRPERVNKLIEDFVAHAA